MKIAFCRPRLVAHVRPHDGAVGTTRIRRPVHCSGFAWLFLLGSLVTVSAAAQAQTLPASASPVHFTTVPKGDVLTEHSDGSATVTTPVGNMYRYYIDANKSLQVQMTKFVGLEPLTPATPAVPEAVDEEAGPHPGEGLKELIGTVLDRARKSPELPEASSPDSPQAPSSDPPLDVDYFDAFERAAQKVGDIVCALDRSGASAVCAPAAIGAGPRQATLICRYPLLEAFPKNAVITVRKSSGAYSVPVLIGGQFIVVPGVPVEPGETVHIDFSRIVTPYVNVATPNAAPKPAEPLTVEVHGQTVTINLQGTNSTLSERPIAWLVNQPSEAGPITIVPSTELVYRPAATTVASGNWLLVGDIEAAGGVGTMGSGSGGVFRVGGRLRFPLRRVLAGLEGGFEFANATTVASVGTRTPPSGGPSTPFVTSSYATTTSGMASPFVGASVLVPAGPWHFTMDGGVLFPTVTLTTTGGVCVSGNATRPGTCTDGAPTSNTAHAVRPYVGVGATYPIARFLDLAVGARVESPFTANGLSLSLGTDLNVTAGVCWKIEPRKIEFTKTRE